MQPSPHTSSSTTTISNPVILRPISVAQKNCFASILSSWTGIAVSTSHFPSLASVRVSRSNFIQDLFHLGYHLIFTKVPQTITSNTSKKSTSIKRRAWLISSVIQSTVTTALIIDKCGDLTSTSNAQDDNVVLSTGWYLVDAHVLPTFSRGSALYGYWDENAKLFEVFDVWRLGGVDCRKFDPITRCFLLNDGLKRLQSPMSHWVHILKKFSSKQFEHMVTSDWVGAEWLVQGLKTNLLSARQTTPSIPILSFLRDIHSTYAMSSQQLATVTTAKDIRSMTSKASLALSILRQPLQTGQTHTFDLILNPSFESSTFIGWVAKTTTKVEESLNFDIHDMMSFAESMMSSQKSFEDWNQRSWTLFEIQKGCTVLSP